MIPRTDLSLVAAVTGVTRIASANPAADPRQEAFERSLQGMIGKAMQGDILARLTDGNFLVRVAGTAARMPLPAGAQVGSQVQLTLVSTDPRPAFEVGSGAAGQRPLVYADASLAQASLRANRTASVLASAPLVPAEQGPAGDVDSSTTQLSDTGRVLASVLASALKNPHAETAVVARTPLVASPQAQPEQMAAALKDAIGASGLFYESHVAEWAAGKRTLPDLLREPQMQQAAALAATESGQRQPAAGIDTAAAQLINLQLASHEQARIAWQGEVWPGQQMEWDIQKEEDGQHGAGAEESHVWRSGVRFRFALLGEVAGSVILEGGRLHIHLSAASDASGALLRHHAASLGAALEAAGTPLSSLDIHARAQTGDG